MSWAHETLIQLLDSDLLPVYLDILQILKSKVCSHDLVFYHCSATVQSKLCSSLLPSSSLLLSFSLQCPVLVEQMVHSSLGLVGGEAFSLLLKRPWNPVVGMTPVDRLVGNLTPATFTPLQIYCTMYEGILRNCVSVRIVAGVGTVSFPHAVGVLRCRSLLSEHFGAWNRQMRTHAVHLLRTEELHSVEWVQLHSQGHYRLQTKQSLRSLGA